MEQMPAKGYDLILMDVQMPHMDGYKATETIRELSDEGKAHIPIVALTFPKLFYYMFSILFLYKYFFYLILLLI